jgi:hypothetical protein
VREGVRLVRMHLVRALAGPAPRPLDGLDAVDQRREDAASGAVGRGEEDGEWEALPVDKLRAGPILNPTAHPPLRIPGGQPETRASVANSWPARERGTR